MADATEAGAQTAKAGGHGLSKKLGPLPIWAWAAVVIGSYLLFHYLRSRNSGGSTVPSGTVQAGNGAAPIGGLQIGPGGQIYDPTTGSIVGSITGAGGQGTGPNTTTAQGWLAAAQTALQGLGLDNNTINGALNDYAAGSPLPPAEYNIIQEAIKIVGAAPSSLGNPSQGPPGPPPPPSNPYADELFQGSGYNAGSEATGIVTSLGGGKFSWLPSGNAVQAAQANGSTLYYQPTPGNFQAIGPGFNQWANTPIFEKVG